MRRLGHGAMGQVWLAVDSLLDRHVAIKFLATAAADPGERERFLIEARAVARLSHPNVVAVFRVGTLEGQPYIVSEYLEGEGLDRLAKPVPAALATRLGLDLARGLAAAHRRGVLHRDVKPANAFRCHTGEAKLLDFGLAKLLEGAKPVTAGPPVVLEKGAALDDTVPAPLAAPSAGGDGAASPAATRAGTVMGTPLYMAPECWAGEPATRASDVYSLGALVYELCAGRAPSLYLPEGDLGQRVRELPMRPLAETAPQVDRALAATVDRCLERDPSRRFESAEALVRELERLSGEPRGDGKALEGNPYRGLATFEADHQSVFFGRGQESREVIDRLRAEPVVLITGASGAGKSSLARAGVLPRVRAGALGEGRSWQTATWVPGRRPLSSLAAALAGTLELGAAELAEQLRQQPRELVRLLARKLGAQQGLMLFVDQLEELVTVADRDEVERVSSALADFGLRVPGLKLLATARADLLPSLHTLPELGPELVRSLYLLGPMANDSLVEVVEAPAAAAGVRFETPAMVDEFVEFGRAGGALPILQFALAELFDARDAGARVMTQAALARLGGVAGSLARHADDVLETMTPKVRAAARAVLLNLCTADDTRAQRVATELLALDPEAKPALELLVRGRLLVARTSSTGTAYELAHDALLVEWPQLRHWLHEDDRARALRARIHRTALEWERLQHSAELLWSARQLAELDALGATLLPALEQRFIDASRRAARLARWRTALALAAVLALAVGAGGWTRYLDRRQLEQQVSAELDKAARAGDELAAFERDERQQREKALALFAKNAWAEAEPPWAAALGKQREVERSRARHLSALEAAFALDPGRAELREHLADALLQAALWAEGLDRADEQALWLERLLAFDPGGKRRARLSQPAVVELTSGEKATAVGPTGGETALGARTALAPGAWTVRLARGVLPLWLKSGETLQLKLAGPERVPEGLVFVPAGRFYFGATADEDLRRGFFETSPAHLRQTGPYFIARHELTVGEYLEFLRELPAAERARRTPGPQGSEAGEAVGAMLQLEPTPGGYRYRLRVTSVLHQARDGEPVVYASRSKRREQRWERFPMTGISAEDAEAYAAWLAKSGRVPGARLCSEEEWERAARGADRRAFPHGDVLEPDDANFDVTYGRDEGSFGPDEVGSHPASNSAYGVADASGNAWEIVRSSVDPGQFVIRGGCFFVGAATNRLYNRSATSPSLRHATVGTRICADFVAPR
ncbi:MAG: SUMF1/EgtB/PvdO family nonheme iron enzyme [Archangiaceae bacterium]|nr:SUMF1/EgtB/PvdO family nonheme iron enzyme [Archangiaceae bacterium]